MPEFFPIPPVGAHFALSPALAPSPAAASPGAAIPAGSGSSIVQLSGFGQLLSAVAGFQNRLENLQPRFAGGASPDFTADFGKIAAGAQSLADAFNSLQGRLNEMPGISFVPGSRSGLTQGFQLALNAQAGASFNNGDSIFTGLARIGVNFQPPVIAGTGGSLNVDLEALRNALNFDSAGTFSLLGQATQALSDVATRFAGQTASASSVFGLLAQMQATQMALSLTDLSATGAGIAGLSDQAALALVPGDAIGSRQRAIAVNQFNRISSLF